MICGGSDAKMNTAEAACCPAGSLPALDISDMEAPLGKVVEMSGVRVYITDKADEAKRAIIMFSDVWGFGSGRHRALCDYFAEHLGAAVYLPALQPQTPKYFKDKKGNPQQGPDNDGLPLNFPFNGDTIPDLMKWAALNPWSDVKAKVDVVMKEICSKNFARIDTMGFCWGVWAAFHASADYTGMFSSHVGFHPSVQVEAIFESNVDGSNPWNGKLIEIDVNPVTALANTVDHPVYLMPAGNDNKKLYHESEGQVAQVLTSKTRLKGACKFDYFEDMGHGWVSRGDRKDKKTDADINDALKRAVNYLK